MTIFVDWMKGSMENEAEELIRSMGEGISSHYRARGRPLKRPGVKLVDEAGSGGEGGVTLKRAVGVADGRRPCARGVNEAERMDLGHRLGLVLCCLVCPRVTWTLPPNSHILRSRNLCRNVRSSRKVQDDNWGLL